LFRDIKRLRAILTNPEMPVQIVIAGKAHPKDHPGKALIREIVQLSREADLYKRIVFLEDYDIQVGRELVQGVDLWLNNPRHGWFDEAYEHSGGWAIGDREPYSEDQDEIHASAIYSLLENEVVPMYYKDREEGVPEEWMKRVKLSLKNLSERFNAQRMLADYRSQLYLPAHRVYTGIQADGFDSVRERARWTSRVHDVWPQVSFKSFGPEVPATLTSGRPMPLHVSVDLAGLSPEDVRVEAVIGRVSGSGQLEQTEVLTLKHIEINGGEHVFGREFLPMQTGRLGFSVRISPNHSDDPLTRPCNSLIKWGID
jgi:starch phosphorylase